LDPIHKVDEGANCGDNYMEEGCTDNILCEWQHAGIWYVLLLLSCSI
jgi:hypothetical protein